MSTVRKSANDIMNNPGRIDDAKISALADTDREQIRINEGIDDDYLVACEPFVPAVDVKQIREHLGDSQELFAQRYCIPLRTLQDWEQHRREPSETVRAFLFAIATDPQGIQSILRRGFNQRNARTDSPTG